MTPEASKTYFDLLEKTASIWEGSSDEFQKVAAGGRIREYIGGLLQGARGRVGDLGTRIVQSGNRAGGDMVLHPRTNELVRFNRLSKSDKMEVLRAQATRHSDDMAAQAARHADEMEALRRASSGADAVASGAQGAGKATPGGFARRGLLGGALLGTGGAGLYYLGRRSGEEGALNNRNLAFGGGLAAGLAAPHVLTGVNQIVANQGLLPTGPYSPGNFQRI